MISLDACDGGNQLLAALPANVVVDVGNRLQAVELKAGDALYEAGANLNYVYFPSTAVVSLFAPLVTGVGAEVAVIGREGIVGVGALLGAKKDISSAIVQRSGLALRIGAPDIEKLVRDVESIRIESMRYAQSLLTSIAQKCACHSHHSFHEQLCCWMLEHLDRQVEDDLYITQERIGGMLGVRRETVTEAALKLQREGIIDYHRGLIKVLNRPALENQCCECYGVIHRAFDHLRKSPNKEYSVEGG